MHQYMNEVVNARIYDQNKYYLGIMVRQYMSFTIHATLLLVTALQHTGNG